MKDDKNTKAGVAYEVRRPVYHQNSCVVMFNEKLHFDSLEEAKAYALEYGGKVFVSETKSNH